ncbi:MAG: prepilin peptidase [Lachnospiraceae bacterium]|nr:prepilin peptidase [Lachnospiraceae bacterium]
MAVNYIFIGIFLGICSLSDLRRRSIDERIIVSGFIILAGLVAAELALGSISLRHFLSGAAVGIASLAVAFGTKEKLGLGDACILCICCPLLGAVEGLMVVLIGCLLAAFVSGFFLAGKKLNLKSELPFVPFLLAGVLGTMVSL